MGILGRPGSPVKEDDSSALLAVTPGHRLVAALEESISRGTLEGVVARATTLTAAEVLAMARRPGEA